MRRRAFIKMIGTASVAAVTVPYLPAFAESVSRTRSASIQTSRYRIQGNKKLGCSGFDFPDDPDIIDNGYFMPKV
ncbi:MAG: hypothetical protein KKG33_14945 [candidate division Zixibacteria bacterium]|nr:hypothetical protein [candidate division Zixibacteria bacterium]MBU1469643.1 hypothetical protein [candidate division Zixibacteria bacterium]MBU2626848.1 hypothetical protein [candidate division Zixibacteria bacterium]